MSRPGSSKQPLEFFLGDARRTGTPRLPFELDADFVAQQAAGKVALEAVMKKLNELNGVSVDPCESSDNAARQAPLSGEQARYSGESDDSVYTVIIDMSCPEHVYFIPGVNEDEPPVDESPLPSDEEIQAFILHCEEEEQHLNDIQQYYEEYLLVAEEGKEI